MTGTEGFFAMGGYGAFVWPAYGVTALILVWLLFTTLHRLRCLQRDLAEHRIAPPGGGGGKKAAP